MSGESRSDVGLPPRGDPSQRNPDDFGDDPDRDGRAVAVWRRPAARFRNVAADWHSGWYLLVDLPGQLMTLDPGMNRRDVMPVDKETGKPMDDGP